MNAASDNGYPLSTSYKRKRSSKACKSEQARDVLHVACGLTRQNVGATCRQKKVKCSGTGPPCAHCIEYGEVCSFNESGPIPSSSTIDALQGRIARLEDYIYGTGVELPTLSRNYKASAVPPWRDSASLSITIPPQGSHMEGTSGNRNTPAMSVRSTAGNIIQPQNSPQNDKSGSTSLIDSDSYAGELGSSNNDSLEYQSPVISYTMSGREEEIMDNASQRNIQQLRPDKRGNLRYLGEQR